MNGSFAATPIQPLNLRLNDNTFHVKRDDLIPYSFGGNKVRKGILFFEAIRSGGHDAVVTYGSSSSNHCRVIANLAKEAGLPCRIIAPQEASRETMNSRLIRLLGAEVTTCPVNAVAETIEDAMAHLVKSGKNPYFIPGGGHGRLGTEAYVRAYEEIRANEEATGIRFDFIFLTSGTGSTQAGLVSGQLRHQDDRQVIGISNARRSPYGRQVVLDSVLEYLGREAGLKDSDRAVHFIDDYILEGYGAYNRAILDTIKEVFGSEGIPLDATYTGKGFWGMKEYIKANRITGKHVLFIHTGGTPLFFDTMEALQYE